MPLRLRFFAVLYLAKFISRLKKIFSRGHCGELFDINEAEGGR